jgi:uncharacterized membrane protein
MITLEWLYVVMGVYTAGVALVSARDATNPRRFNNAAFWGLYAVTFLLGSRIPHFTSGCIVIAMVLVSSIGKLGQGAPRVGGDVERAASARRLGNRLFIPALTIPAVTLAGTFLFKGVSFVDQKQVTLISLGIATVVSLVVAIIVVRDGSMSPLGRLGDSIVEARRLLDSVGWAAVLPQMLAALGALFAVAGVGKVVAQVATQYLPLGSPFAAVVAYTTGMALFTMIMGNAFAAFPVMTAGIGLPLIYGRFGGSITVMAAVGMLSGFCGTLMTPMAANFNIVPAALLELPDEYAVIKAQVPTGILVLIANTAIMYLFVYRH